ncbi:MAG TPA: lysylphosphatidylglycerol synthase transmembrane domain-containing protein [Ignavibacteria bacterium]|nr:lysylphosphatidylglycerol synthase transmembrane domain-containing protein [Ignavibacteria bacterium]HMR40240.1 lysylphosphatidylglycerol synthase transmembrane domain-containing protein [Ignavibacteria bacterium]
MSVALGAAVFLAFSIYADFDNLLKAFREFNWLYFPLVIALTYGNFIIRFFKWEYYRKLLGIELKTKASFLIFMSTFVMSVTPGKMGELLKSYLVREENGTPVSKSAPIILAERITDFISVVMLCIAGSFVFDYGQGLILGAGVFFLGCVALISSRKISIGIISQLEKIKAIHKISEKIREAYESIYTLVRIKPLVIAVILSLFAWFLECLGLYVVLRVYSSFTHIDVNVLSAVFIYGFSTIVGSIAMLPGGLGLTEASLTGLMQFLKIPKDISVASTFIIRIATLWFSVIVGIISVYFYQRYSHKNLENLEMNN